MAVDLLKLARLFESHEVGVEMACATAWFTAEEKIAIANALRAYREQKAASSTRTNLK